MEKAVKKKAREPIADPARLLDIPDFNSVVGLGPQYVVTTALGWGAVMLVGAAFINTANITSPYLIAAILLFAGCGIAVCLRTEQLVWKLVTGLIAWLTLGSMFGLIAKQLAPELVFIILGTVMLLHAGWAVAGFSTQMDTGGLSQLLMIVFAGIFVVRIVTPLLAPVGDPTMGGLTVLADMCLVMVSALLTFADFSDIREKSLPLVSAVKVGTEVALNAAATSTIIMLLARSVIVP